MATEFLYPISDVSSDWPSPPAWNRVDDDVVHGGSDDGLFVNSTGSGAQDAKCAQPGLSGHVAGIVDVKPHGNGEAGTGSAVAAVSAWTGSNDAGSITWNDEVASTKIGTAIVDPDSGEPWIVANVSALEIHFFDVPEFGEIRRIHWGHLDIDTIEGSIGGGVIIGACWWPPLVAALGDYILRYEPVEVIQSALNKVWGCRGIRPRLRNRDEREIVLNELERRPRFAF